MSDAETQAPPQVGATAPDFTLPDADGRDWRLSDQRGRVVVLLFYPGDETPVGLFIKRVLRFAHSRRRRGRRIK